MRHIYFYLSLIKLSVALWFPHLSPKGYDKDEVLDIFAGQLMSDRATIPFDFYKLSWCDSTAGHAYDINTIGVSMTDNKMVESPYTFKLGTKKIGSTACTKTIGLTEYNQFSAFVQNGYEYRLYLDDLPSATIVTSPTGESKIDYQHGIPIGKYDRETKELMIYNHLEMTVRTHWESGSDK